MEKNYPYSPTLNRGFSILELLASLLLFSIISLSIFNCLKASNYLYKEVSIDNSVYEQANFFFLQIENYFNQALSLYNLDTVRIHKQSIFLDQDDKEIIVGKSNPSLKPNSESDAISFLIINNIYPLEKLNLDEDSPYCLANNSLSSENKSELSSYKYFYLLFLNHYQEVEGKINRLSKSIAGCLNGYLYNLSSIQMKSSIFSTISNSESSKNSPLIVFPIKESLSFYLDQNNFLRRLSILTGENQAIIADVKSLLITEQATANNIRTITLTLNLFINNKKEVKSFTRELQLPAQVNSNSSYLDIVL